MQWTNQGRALRFIEFALWFPIVIALLTVAIGAVFLRNTKDTNLEAD